MDKDRLDRQIEFIREIDKEKSIGRQTYLADASRKEDDAEHAWHMAIMTVLLSEYANEKIDVLRTMTMLLIHDLVEIDAGDTYAYDENAKKTQRERELKCADRIFSILPEDQGKYMRELWEEFEAQETPEAKFARTMDNFQPVILNDASKGKSWAEKGVHLSQILKRNARTGEGSEELWKYSYEKLIMPNVKKGILKRMLQHNHNAEFMLFLRVNIIEQTIIFICNTFYTFKTISVKTSVLFSGMKFSVMV